MSEQYQVAEQTMNSMWEFIEAGEMDHAMNRYMNLGYSALVNEFVFNPDSYYFPNIRGKQVLRPNAVSEDAIPVFVMKPGQYYKAAYAPRLHPVQESSLQEQGYDKERIAEWNTLFSKEEGNIYPSPNKTVVASVLAAVVEAGIASGEGSYIRAKPIVIINADQYEERCTGVLLHELVHVAQDLAMPIADPNKEIQKELEAYHIQDGLTFSENVPYSMSSATAGLVNSFRTRHLGRDNFVPNKKFLEKCAKDTFMRGILSFAAA